MPKLTGPLFSVEATGALADALTYQRRPGGAAVYGYRKPKVPLTAKQILQRWLVTNAVACWQALSDEVKAEWELKAKGFRQSGYSLFMHENTAIGYNMYLAPDFSVGTGSILPDLSRFRSHGSIVGATWADGLHGKCLDFDPTIPSYVEIPASFTQLNFTSEDFSIIARVYIDDLSTSRIIFCRSAHWEKDGYYIGVSSGGRAFFRSCQNGSTQRSESDADIGTATWWTIGFVRDGTTCTIYLNGVDKTSLVQTLTDPKTSSQAGIIGVSNNKAVYPFDGKIEFLRIFGGIALSPSAHLAWHNALK